MGLKTEWVQFGVEKEYSGFAAWPERAAGPLPAVIVIQEAWGVDPYIQDVTQRIAKAGYVAFAPDLFARNGVRQEPFTAARLAELQAFLNLAPPAVWTDPALRDGLFGERPEGARLKETMSVLFSKALQPDQYMPLVTATSTFLRSEFAASKGQKVGSVGFCMGGGVSALLACHDPLLAGAAIFYGASPSTALVPKIECPIVGFYGGNDKRINDGIPAFAEAMRSHGRTFTSHIYDGANHAFFNDNRPSYHVGASRDATARLFEFFREALA